MNPTRWQQVEVLYNAARERGPEALDGAPDQLFFVPTARSYASPSTKTVDRCPVNQPSWHPD